MVTRTKSVLTVWCSGCFFLFFGGGADSTFVIFEEMFVNLIKTGGTQERIERD